MLNNKKYNNYLLTSRELLKKLCNHNSGGTMSKFSDNIKILLESQKKNQKELAEFLGYSDSAISQYVKGVREPGINDIKKIANFFNLTIDQLIDNDLIIDISISLLGLNEEQVKAISLIVNDLRKCNGE